MAEMGAIRTEPLRQWVSMPVEQLDMPASVQAIVASRMDRLDQAPRSLLLMASVIGKDLRMDVLHRRVTRGGQVVPLSPREFDVLQVLMQEPGRVFSRTELCELVWEREHEYDMRTVDILIGRLRKKVDAGFVPLIHTSRAVGYTVRAPGAVAGNAPAAKW